MKVHFLGIGGSGASAAAAIAQAQGYEVTGCDLEPHNEFTTQFKFSQLLKGHDPKHLAFHPKVFDSEGLSPQAQTRRGVGSHKGVGSSVGSNIDIFAVTPAIFSLDPNNPELIEAKERKIPVLTWQQFLGEYLTKDKFVIAICGTHGKTTTTAMIAKILEDARLDPTVLLGAIVPRWGTNYRIPRQTVHDREYFVIEADEYNDNFLHFKPDISVVTSIEMDHPEYFNDFTSYKESFKKFLLQTKKIILANMQDKSVAEVVNKIMKQSSVFCFDYSKNHHHLKLKIPGSFNRLNAQAAFLVGLQLGIKPEVIQKSLSSYTGVGRRFEYLGQFNGAKVYSDFGHHPTEIKETLKAVREKFPKKRILLIYQPHMFTRTKYFFDDFVKVFKEVPADKVFIMDIYQSREHDLGETSSKQLADAVNKNSVVYIGSTPEVLEKLKPEIKNEDILIFMSAGDTDKLARKLIAS